MILAHHIRLKRSAGIFINLNMMHIQKMISAELHKNEKKEMGMNILFAFKKPAKIWLSCNSKNMAVKKNIQILLLLPPGKTCWEKLSSPEKESSTASIAAVIKTNAIEENNSLPGSIILLAVKKTITPCRLNPNKRIANAMLLKKMENSP